MSPETIFGIQCALVGCVAGIAIGVLLTCWFKSREKKPQTPPPLARYLADVNAPKRGR